MEPDWLQVELMHYPVNYKDLVYLAGRNCYGLEDLNGVEEGRKSEFIKKIIANNHLSVIEHVPIGIFIKNCSRSFLAQLTRHRLASYSVKSQHFVRHKDFKYKALEHSGMRREYCELMQKINKFYCDAIEQGMPHYVAREVLPNSCLTNIYMTANAREFRHIIKMRIGPENTPEIKTFCNLLLMDLEKVMPELFGDLNV